MWVFFVFIIGSTIDSKFAKIGNRKSERIKIDDLDKNNFCFNIPLISLISLKNKRFYDI